MQSADAVKVVVLGGSSAGKTSLLARFANDVFLETRGVMTTVGAGFFSKSVMVGTDRVKLHIWDTVGSERYNSITRMYYRQAQAGILCYDITDHRSFTDVQFWSQELVKNEPECRQYLCGCKRDLQGDRRQVSEAKAEHFAKEIGAIFFETSARTGENVVALFNRICLDAVNWSFTSITTGIVADEKDRPANFAPAGAGTNAPFSLNSKERRREDSRCFGRKCQIA